eukprot:TRINITY_DN9186_c0_g1_i3.p2 TRINITY_DN9186_c0_g1~~TRINITY_DN9186_c0_g1_i3.p2  ORF type:complete len:355 (+),score=65.17 TRINITY_DN9186_c0_g1_i3:42-1106(+)
MAGYPRSKAVDSHHFLVGRERPVQGEIMGRKDGDAQRLFPRFTHASAAATDEVEINGRALKLWSFSQLETLNSSALRQRAMAIKDILPEGECPPLPSGHCQDLVRWILHMQEQMTGAATQEGRSGGYGNGHFVPPSFAQDTKERPVASRQSNPAETIPFRAKPDAQRDHYRDLKLQQNEFKEAKELGIQSGREGGEGRRHIFPKQNMVCAGMSAAEPAGIQTLKDTPEGRRYIPAQDNIRDNMEVAWQQPPAIRTAVGGPAHHVGESHLDRGDLGCINNEETPIGGERRRHANIPEDHFVGQATFEVKEGIHGRRYLDGFQKAALSSSHAGTQGEYKSNWKKNPAKLLGSSMII